MLAALLDDFKDALMSGLAGTSRPAQLLAGGIWVDTSEQAAPNYKWSMKLYTGTADREILSIDVLTGASGFNVADGAFTIRKTSDDAVGAILNLMKARVSDGGQVKIDDLIARFRFVGHTIDNADVVTAYMQAVSEEDMTSANRGVIFSFHSTPEGTNSVLEHLRFIQGTIESVVTHKFHSLIFGSDSVVGSENMVIADDKLVTEITGDSGANIHGVEAESGGTKFKIIVNSGTRNLTLKHQSVVADEAERLKLPEGEDITIPPEGSVVIFYCSAESRWKYISGAIDNLTKDIFEIRGGYTEWVAPITGNIHLVTYKNQVEIAGVTQSNAFGKSALGRVFSWGNNQHGQLGLGDAVSRSTPTLMVGGPVFTEVRIGENSSWGRDTLGQNYSWGLNQHGQLGLGDVIPKSSPVAVIGGSVLSRVEIKESSYGLRGDGVLYAWGLNSDGQLGLGDTTPYSSPVAVLGGLRFSEFYTGVEGQNRIFAIEKDTGELYAWGLNPSGSLGVGDTTPRSSPVAVLHGLKYTKVAVGEDSTVGITSEGDLYSWGLNDAGQLGVGDTVSRSSPVAVLGGLKFSNVVTISNKSYMALTKNGLAYTWGENNHGQLGDGTAIDKSSPVAVAGGLRFGKVPVLSGDGSILIFQRGSGVVYGWGKNSSGELGAGDTDDRSSPTLVLGSKLFYDVKMGPSFAYGFADDGLAYSWGKNTQGQLGDGTTVDRSSPALISGAEFITPAIPITEYKVLPVVKGATYVVRLGGGVSYFGDVKIGSNIGRITIAYYN